MKDANFNSLTEKIIRPGIEDKLVPLCLYKGTSSLGDIHRKWNLIISAMEAECNNITELVKFSSSTSHSHLCEPPHKFQNTGLLGFLSRLADNPNVMNNISGLPAYVRHLFNTRYNCGGSIRKPFKLQKISLYGERTNTPWRFEIRKSRPARHAPSTIQETLCYPYVIHKPTNGGDEYEMMLTVNKAVGGGAPDFLRADICQDLIVSILCGETSVENIKDSVTEATRKVLKMHPTKYGPISLDAPVYSDDGKTFGEMIDSEAFHLCYCT